MNPFGVLKKLNPVKPIEKGIKMVKKQMVLGIVRHVLTTAGGFVVGSGYLSSSEYESAAGAVIALVGIAWSVLEKRNAEK